MATQRNDGRAAIVTTLRNAGAVLDSFVAYHLAIGFDHVFLFFDDPDDPDLPRMAAHPAVTAIARDAGLRQAWSALPQYAAHAAFTDTEVMSRQVLNAVLAMGMARERGLDWLLHIDADEVFYSPNESAAAHFSRLQNSPLESVVYLNYEAVPERDEIDDFIREVDLFKRPLSLAPNGPDARRMVAETSQLAPKFFSFYSNGKSAVRLSAPGVEPLGVHGWGRMDRATAVEHSPHHFILHYACCGFETFWTKYATLGRFADKWWRTADIVSAIGPLHLDARDVVASGDRDAARAFYRRRIAMLDPAKVAPLIGAGLLARLSQPRQILGAMPTGEASR